MNDDIFACGSGEASPEPESVRQPNAGPVFTVLGGYIGLHMVMSPSSLLKDLKALLDSYAVRLDCDGVTYWEGPAYWLGSRPDVPRRAGDFFFPEIDKRLRLTMARYVRSGESECSHRWPFWVEQKVVVCFVLQHVDPIKTQWWQFTFNPGKTYEERTIDPQSVSVERSQARPEDKH